jgi:hypothetical protein
MSSIDNVPKRHKVRKALYNDGVSLQSFHAVFFGLLLLFRHELISELLRRGRSAVLSPRGPNSDKAILVKSGSSIMVPFTVCQR